MKVFFKDLFEYSHHCNQELAKVIDSKKDEVSEKSLKLYNHILNAHQIWNARIDSRFNLTTVWEMRPQADLAGIDRNNFLNSLTILEDHDLDTVVQYKTSKGDPFKNSIKEVLFHVINHSTYHRGQIASNFRETGIVPLVSDYIFYKR